MLAVFINAVDIHKVTAMAQVDGPFTLEHIYHNTLKIRCNNEHSTVQITEDLEKQGLADGIWGINTTGRGKNIEIKFMEKSDYLKMLTTGYVCTAHNETYITEACFGGNRLTVFANNVPLGAPGRIVQRFLEEHKLKVTSAERMNVKGTLIKTGSIRYRCEITEGFTKLPTVVKLYGTRTIGLRMPGNEGLQDEKAEVLHRTPEFYQNEGNEDEALEDIELFWEHEERVYQEAHKETQKPLAQDDSWVTVPGTPRKASRGKGKAKPVPTTNSFAPLAPSCPGASTEDLGCTQETQQEPGKLNPVDFPPLQKATSAPVTPRKKKPTPQPTTPAKEARPEMPPLRFGAVEVSTEQSQHTSTEEPHFDQAWQPKCEIRRNKGSTTENSRRQ